MEVNNNNLISGQSEIVPQSTKIGVITQPHPQPQSKELVSSGASLAARAYATPQIHFEGQRDKLIREIMQKPSGKVKLAFEQAATLLTYLGLEFRQSGSHFIFGIPGRPSIIIPKPHGSGEKHLKPCYVQMIRDVLQSSSVVAV